MHLNKKAFPYISGGALILLVVQSFFMKFGMPELQPVRYFDEVVLIIMLPFSFYGAYEISKQSYGWLIIAVGIIYIFISIFSSIFGQSSFFQFFYQALLDSKYVIAFLFSFALYREGETEKVLRGIIGALLWGSFVMVLFQFLLPGIYKSALPVGAAGFFRVIGGGDLPRAVGLFEFTGILAIFSAAAITYYLSDFFQASKVKVISVMISATLLLSTFSRGEIFALVLALYSLYFFWGRESSRNISSKFGAFLLVLIFGVTFNEYVLQALDELGFSGYYEGMAPRGLFSLVSKEIADDYFPFGAGLGVFGGAGAVASDSNLFYEYKIAYEWYFDHGFYLTDTYWPKFIAESGYFGCAAYLTLLVLIVWSFISSRARTSSVYYTAVMQLFLLVTSFSSPVYGSLFGVLISSFLCGSLKQNHDSSKIYAQEKYEI